MQAHISAHANMSSKGLLNQPIERSFGRSQSLGFADVLERTPYRSLVGNLQKGNIRSHGLKDEAGNRLGKGMCIKSCRSTLSTPALPGYCKNRDQALKTLPPRQIFRSVNQHRARHSTCRALSGEEKELASNEGSALSEKGREKEKVITEGWLEGSAFQIAFVSLCLATALVPVAPKFEFSGQLYMTIIASLTIYVGSHRSLKGQIPSTMTLKNSFAVPFFSSAVLFGFWCLLKYLPDLDLKVVLKSYLFLVGSIAVGSNLGAPLARLLPSLAEIKKSITFPKWLIQDEGEAVTSDVSATDVLAAAIALTISVVNCFPDAPYSANNFIAICLVSELLQTLSLGSFVTAAALLAGLLCYDVFWVFGSPTFIGDNVMVTVATSKSFLNSPMMLQFPVLNPGPSGRGFTILGLGDVTVPGLLIALALRFDRFRNSSAIEGASTSSSSDRGESTGWEWLDRIDDKTYFRTCLAAYCVGLGLTFVANTVSGAAQPALLYLVPAVLCGGSLAAVRRGEFRALLDYKDRAGLNEGIPEPVEVVDTDKLMK